MGAEKWAQHTQTTYKLEKTNKYALSGCVRFTRTQQTSAKKMGITASGPVAGGLFASAQSAAMGGSVLPLLAWTGVPALAIGLPTAAVALTYNEYADAQTHTMGVPTGLLPGNVWVTMVHNWGSVETRSFPTEAEAVANLRGGRNLRRFLVRLHQADEPEEDNSHGWFLPWSEQGHTGCRPDLDDELRRELLSAIR